MEVYYYKSLIGILEIVYKDNELVSLKIVQKVGLSSPKNDFSVKITSQLDEYFSGKRKFFDIKINLQGTEFQKLVWKELQKIPYGKTKSYSEIAAAIGNKNAQRAIGSACNKNPIMIIIPCHRVISKNGELGGFAYGNAIKQELLKIENCVNIFTPIVI